MPRSAVRGDPTIAKADFLYSEFVADSSSVARADDGVVGNAPLITALNFNAVGDTGTKIRDALTRDYLAAAGDVFDAAAAFHGGIIIKEHGANFAPDECTKLPPRIHEVGANGQGHAEGGRVHPAFINYDSNLVVSDDMKAKEVSRIVTRGRR